VKGKGVEAPNSHFWLRHCCNVTTRGEMIAWRTDWLTASIASAGAVVANHHGVAFNFLPDPRSLCASSEMNAAGEQCKVKEVEDSIASLSACAMMPRATATTTTTQVFRQAPDTTLQTDTVCVGYDSKLRRCRW